MYFRERFLDPSTGTWLTPDAAGYRDSSNLYAYAGGDPVNRSDPRGDITIIVHGTGAKNATWWNTGAFARAVDAQTHDVWKIQTAGDIDVSQVRALRIFGEGGRFSWSGDDTAGARLEGARDLATYINTIRRLFPQEPIRVVTHSHGGNVATAATNREFVRTPASIDALVVLAKPYLSGTQQTDDDEPANVPLLYRPDFNRIAAPILNVFSPQDRVQTFWAGTLNFEDAYTRVRSSRTDPRAPFASRYINVGIRAYVGGEVAHSVLHNTKMGEVVGRYLAGSTRSYESWLNAARTADLFGFMMSQTRFYNPYYAGPAFVGFYNGRDTGD